MVPVRSAVMIGAIVALAARPAAADCRQHCGPLGKAIGSTLATTFIGGYALGTGYFVVRDVTDERQSLGYGGAELGLNLVAGGLFTVAAIDAADETDGHAGMFGALAAVHVGLAVHGGYRVWQHRDELRISDATYGKLAVAGFVTNAIVFGSLLPGGRHGRGFGAAELALNGPLALGLGYLAVDRAREGAPGRALLFGGMAVVSGALAIHGVRTLIDPYEGPVRGAVVAPAFVGAGPGLAVAGAW